MQAVFIRQRPDFNVISYGNGLAYAIEAKPSYASVFVQGEDAALFREEMETLEEIWDDIDEALARLWLSWN